MNIDHQYYIIVNSKGIKTCFYYKDSAIYYNLLDASYSRKEKVLVNKVTKNFICTISENDTIYILCEALSKDVLLFINDGSGWQISKIPIFNNISYVFLITMFFIGESFNIFFCGKIPLADYFIIFHAIKKNNRWEIINVCKIFSTKVGHESLRIMVENNAINLICALNNNNEVALKHYRYDSLMEKWYENTIINICCSNNLKIKMQSLRGELYLICYFNENSKLTFLIFKKSNDLKSIFSLSDINKIPLSNNLGLFYLDLKDYILNILRLEDYKIQSWSYDFQSKNLIKANKLPHNYSITELKYIELEINLGKDGSIKEEKIFTISNDFEVEEFQYKNINSSLLPVSKELPTSEKENKNSTDYIINRIDSISEKISSLDNKLMKLIATDLKFGEHKNYRHNNQVPLFIERKAPLNNSDFKEKFMKSKPTTFKINDGTLLKGKFSDLIISDTKKKIELAESKCRMNNDTTKIETVVNEKSRFLKVIESLFK